MAKLAAIAALLFFSYLFTFSSARHHPENDNSKATTTTFHLPNHRVNSAADLTVSFIPINRRFKDRSSFHRFEPQLLSKQHVEISYGNDMLVSPKKTTDLEMPEVVHGGKHHWVRLHRHHGEDSDDEAESDQIKRFVFRNRFGRDEKLNSLKRIRKLVHP